ncbi:MAG: hypothetical protein HP490_07860 [Nitrospira sp.]|nr:hypothetical protein [Nitrospira sp.]
MPYTYDYTSVASGNESASARYWRFAKMTLTRWTRAQTFVFDGQSYPYLYHFCNKTWKNERGVEIPIFREILLRHQTGRILELGNVLAHYVSMKSRPVSSTRMSSSLRRQNATTSS